MAAHKIASSNSDDRRILRRNLVLENRKTSREESDSPRSTKSLIKRKLRRELVSKLKEDEIIRLKNL